jgi:hypothetical protein
MNTITPPSTVTGVNWSTVATSLDDQGYAVTPPLLSPADCAELIALYDDPGPWHSRVEQDRYRLGPGEYKQFTSPLPDSIAALRAECYEALAPIANAWQPKLSQLTTFPAHLSDFLETCHDSGQTNPTSLIQRHRAQDFNCLHQDFHGEHMFPLQLMVMLSRAGKDYTGGEFLLVEHLPRAQSRGRAVTLKLGQAIVWPTSYRPGTGNRGHYRIGVRHGISTVHTGTRYALELNFHEAA